MNPLKNRVLPVVLGAAVVVGAANLTAYAANGHPLLLGQHNSARAATTLTRTGSGPALNLVTGSGSAPLQVSSSSLVANLNADKVDGKSASALQNKVLTFSIPRTTVAPFDLQLTGVPNGRYLASYDVVMNLRGEPGPGLCFFDIDGDDSGLGYGPANGGFTAVSASVVIEVTGNVAPVLSCSGADSIYADQGFPSSVTLLRLDSEVSGSTQPQAHGRPASAPGR